jgi:hypothetical protein
MGSDLNCILSVPNELEKAGFVDLRCVSHKNPLGVWPHDRTLMLCGLFQRTAFMDGMRGLAQRPFGPCGLGWTTAELEVYLTAVRRDLMDPRFHVYFPFHIIYGRKPLT